MTNSAKDQPEEAAPAGPALPQAALPLSVVAAFCIGYAVHTNNGNLHPRGIILVTVALVAGLLAVALPRLRFLDRVRDMPVFVLLAAMLAFQFGQLITHAPGIYLRPRPEGFLHYMLAVGVAAVLSGAVLFAQGRLRHLLFAALLCSHAYLGAWLLETSPQPHIDVFVFQRDGLIVLLQGNNPYTHQFPDIYGNSPFYGPGLSVNGVLQFGFPYPPGSLLMALPGHLLGKDYRFSQLAALIIAAALMAYARPSPHSFGVAALMLFTPKIFFILEQGWTEPLLVVLLAATVFLAFRAPRFLFFPLGLLFASKQYVVFLLPAIFLLFPRPFDKKRVLDQAWKTAAVALVLTLPFALWNFPAFYKSVVTLQFLQPFRTESLAYLAHFKQGDPTPLGPLANLLPVTSAVVAGVLCFWRCPRTPSGFALGCAFTLLAFIAFSKQAFCNHYFFPLGAFCIAAATWGTLPSPAQVPSPDRGLLNV